MNTKVSRPSVKLLTQKSKSNLNSTLTFDSKIHNQPATGSTISLNKQQRQQQNISYSQIRIQQNCQTLESQMSMLSSTPKYATKSQLKEKTGNPADDIKRYQDLRKTKNHQKDNLVITKPRKANQTKQSGNLKQENSKQTKVKKQQKAKFTDQKEAENNIQFKNAIVDIMIFPQSSATVKVLSYSQLEIKLNEALNQNKQLKNKIEQYKSLNQQNKKLLRDQIISFNIEGEETKKNKQAFEALQKINQTLSFQKSLLSEQKTQLVSQIQHLQTKLIAETLFKTHLQLEKTDLVSKIAEVQKIYQVLKQQHEKSTKQFYQQKEKLKSLITINPEISNFPFEQKLNRSSSQFDQITDLSFNSNLKEEQTHISKPFILQNATEDFDFSLSVKILQDKYRSLIEQLKQKLIDAQKENFEMQYENSRRNQPNLHIQIDIDTDKRVLELLRGNNSLKITEYQLKDQMKRLREQKTIVQLRLKQLAFDNQLEIQKLNVAQKYFTQKQQSEIHLLRRENEDLKAKLNQHHQMIKTLSAKKQPDALTSLKLLSAVKKNKYFK